MPRATSNKPGWSDERIARYATAITVQVKVSGQREAAIGKALDEEFTAEELERGLRHLNSINKR
ncbi:hypothetical protein SGFS_013210 [Streptomyces graminofaciens]|uniref:Uncharacterized protein n=1 Tax=Streptomyces graminofaciens TaxID=68212 RepID=A0ABN5V9P8_9ACTN|nr:hypothetical protein [Streptomyces graminofaciens]BBC30027.1 hypothetical protein SGFS_013210 [Streptomyces graminofaciens]